MQQPQHLNQQRFPLYSARSGLVQARHYPFAAALHQRFNQRQRLFIIQRAEHLRDGIARDAALPAGDPRPLLVQALRFLGQPAEEGWQDSPLALLLSQAITRWAPAQIPLHDALKPDEMTTPFLNGSQQAMISR